jgi:hypothetical protein
MEAGTVCRCPSTLLTPFTRPFHGCILTTFRRRSTSPHWRLVLQKKKAQNVETSRIQFLISDKPFLSELRFGFYLGDEAGHDLVSPFIVLRLQQHADPAA